jgi:bifunctional isochorismate lyase/aryl carrier protein
VLVHDMQKYFLRPYSPDCPALIDAVRHTADILRAARTAGVPVYYTAQTGQQTDVVRGLQGDFWGPGMRPVPEHTAIVENLVPAPQDTVLVKHRYSAFSHSDLAERLAAQGRDQLVVTGVYAHIGVTATATDAFMREVCPFVVADAVADFGAQEHARALAQVASCCGAVVLADEVVASLAAATSPGGEVPEGWSVVVREALAAVLTPEQVARASGDPEGDLFEVGLNSLQAFEVLDTLADAGVDVDFAEFTARPTVAFLVDQGRFALAQ